MQSSNIDRRRVKVFAVLALSMGKCNARVASVFQNSAVSGAYTIAFLRRFLIRSNSDYFPRHNAELLSDIFNSFGMVKAGFSVELMGFFSRDCYHPYGNLIHSVCSFYNLYSTEKSHIVHNRCNLKASSTVNPLAQSRIPMRSKTPTPLLSPYAKHKKVDSEYNWSDVGTGEQARKVSVLSAIRRAAKKVFAIIFLGQKKLKPGECSRSDPGESSTFDRESTLSGWTGYSSPSSFGRSTERKVSGQYRFSGSRFQNSGKDSSSSKSWHLGPVIFSFRELQRATANFAPVHQIGEGGFGTVYKGKLDDGTVVAIKRARKNNYGKSWLLEFKNEIYTLSKIEHMNLVKLYGFLEHEDERVIVVEYVGNGNLREHLDGLRGNRLEMAERLEIAIDVAHALTYLHTYTDAPIIHRDIKASNILITAKLRAKVADFGFARLVSEDSGVTHVSTQVKGSAGYVDPDYLRTFQLTDKSDVYSFGVLLIELITGRRPIELKRPRKDRLTVKWALRRLKDDEAVLVMDPLLKRNRAAIEVAEKMLKLANECVAPTRGTRPGMKCCAEKLWGIRREMKETMVSSSPSVSSSSSATHSFVGRDSDRCIAEDYRRREQQ